jgi:hypothetical protein
MPVRGPVDVLHDKQVRAADPINVIGIFAVRTMGAFFHSILWVGVNHLIAVWVGWCSVKQISRAASLSGQPSAGRIPSLRASPEPAFP